ncbi:MAG: hypothetical protein ACI8Y4_001225 [Candidatus Poriferisodalaceae bacterium]|jgi:hypothetical protein
MAAPVVAVGVPDSVPFPQLAANNAIATTTHMTNQLRLIT